MLAYIDGVLHNTDDKPMVLVFTTDEERVRFAQLIAGMQPEAPLPRMFGMFPNTNITESKWDSIVREIEAKLP